MSDNIHIADTLSVSQVQVQATALLQYNVSVYISPAIVAIVPSSSDLCSLIARCEEIDKEDEELTRLLKDFKIRLQSARQDILEKDNRLAEWSGTIAWLQEVLGKIKAENESLMLGKPELFNKSEIVQIS